MFPVPDNVVRAHGSWQTSKATLTGGVGSALHAGDQIWDIGHATSTLLPNPVGTFPSRFESQIIEHG